MVYIFNWFAAANSAAFKVRLHRRYWLHRLTEPKRGYWQADFKTFNSQTDSIAYCSIISGKADNGFIQQSLHGFSVKR